MSWRIHQKKKRCPLNQLLNYIFCAQCSKMLPWFSSSPWSPHRGIFTLDFMLIWKKWSAMIVSNYTDEKSILPAKGPSSLQRKEKKLVVCLKPWFKAEGVTATCNSFKTWAWGQFDVNMWAGEHYVTPRNSCSNSAQGKLIADPLCEK